MTTLNEELRKILEEVLPTDPAEAVLGSVLLGQVKPSLQGEYADNAIRSTFSVLAQDPTSPIARIEQGYGYYRRPDKQQVEARGPTAQALSDATARAKQPEEKFRAFFMRYVELDDKFPIRIEHVTAQRQAAGANKWKFPDVVVLDWSAVRSDENPNQLDGSLVEVKRGLGEQLFALASIELKVEISLPTFREYFFQCVSNSKWAHASALVIAKPVSDNLLAREIKRLGASYGISVRSFNFNDEDINTLPDVNSIEKLSNAEFEALAKKFTPQDLFNAPAKVAVDWDYVEDMKNQSEHFRILLDWIARCLKDNRAYTLGAYNSLIKITAG